MLSDDICRICDKEKCVCVIPYNRKYDYDLRNFKCVCGHTKKESCLGCASTLEKHHNNLGVCV